jgi:hypothetical protein
MAASLSLLPPPEHGRLDSIDVTLVDRSMRAAVGVSGGLSLHPGHQRDGPPEYQPARSGGTGKSGGTAITSHQNYSSSSSRNPYALPVICGERSDHRRARDVPEHAQ